MLDVRDVSKRFAEVVAVSGLSLRIDRGVTFGLLGPNGAGKTTTMRMILGIMAPDEGSIAWNGERVDERTRAQFGYLPEERGLYGKMRVRDHIVYMARLHGLAARAAAQRADDWIERLSLKEYAQRPCAELSKGNQQKVQVACAAAHSPSLLVLDEPFTGLDPVNAGMLRDVVEELRACGTTLVLSSHEMWQLERLCTEFCIIAHGSVRASGTLAQLRSVWPVMRVRIAPATQAVREAIANVPGATISSVDGDGVVAGLPRSTDTAALLRALVERDAITAFEPIEPSLQELYLRALRDPATDAP
jgi:ABC-2 type transport system ATP-binding protein